MIYSVTFHPEALREYSAASIWYEEQKEGLGIRFERTIDNKISQILHTPSAFPKTRNLYRQAITRTFPFVIVFKVNARQKEVYISSIFHTSRNPRGKYRKL